MNLIPNWNIVKVPHTRHPQSQYFLFCFPCDMSLNPYCNLLWQGRRHIPHNLFLHTFSIGFLFHICLYVHYKHHKHCCVRGGHYQDKRIFILCEGAVPKTYRAPPRIHRQEIYGCPFSNPNYIA